MTVITLEQVRAWHPCPDYTDERLAELAAGRESITPLEALDLPIPAKDRVWLLTQRGALPDAVRRQWVEVVVSRAVREHSLACGIAQVEEWAARWLAGDTEAKTWNAPRAARTWIPINRREGVWKATSAAAWAAVSDAREALLWSEAAAKPQDHAERDRQIADLRAILAAQAAPA